MNYYYHRFLYRLVIAHESQMTGRELVTRHKFHIPLIQPRLLLKYMYIIYTIFSKGRNGTASCRKLILVSGLSCQGLDTDILFFVGWQFLLLFSHFNVCFSWLCLVPHRPVRYSITTQSRDFSVDGRKCSV
jgi:hypothetical protein